MRIEQYILLIVILFSTMQLGLLLHLADSPHQAQEEAVVAADISNGLGWKIFSCLSGSSTHQNLIFSPVSIATSLAILYYGALGNNSLEIRCAISSLLQPPNFPNWCSDSNHTKKENESVAVDEECSDCPPGVYFNALVSALDIYNTTNGTVDIANGIWHHGHLHSLFKHKIKKYFRPDLMALNPEKPVITASRINQWVSNATRGKISSIINDGSIQETDKVFLFNVLYFRALWHTSFTSRNVTDNFTTCMACIDSNIRLTTEGSLEEVEYMEKIETVPYCKTSILTAIRMPYIGKDISMTIILPKLCSIKAVEDQIINGNLLKNIDNCLVPRKTHIILPKFDLEQTLPIDSILSKLGVHSLYSEGFSTILNISNNLQLSKVSHQSVLEVNEEGMSTE